MVTPANVVTFFAQTHWGSPYGVVDQYHPTPHKGLDCGLFHGIVDVPAKAGGIVAAVGPSASVGHYVTIKRPDGWFDTYCHIVPGVKVGDGVAIGARLGRQATTQAEGGTAWKGQHTHLCKSRTLSGWAVWGYVNVDPTPDLIAVLTNAASSGETTLNNTTQKDLTMRLIGLTNGAGILVTDNGTLGLGSAQEYSLIYRIINSNQALAAPLHAGEPFPDTFNAAELAIIDDLLARANDSGPTVAATTTPLLSEADLAKIAAGVDAALKDDIAALAAQIVALDTQSDTYQADLKTILTRGLTISGTATPAK